MAYNKRIAVDFDGVIHAYVTKWTRNWEIHDGPIEGAFEWLESLLAAGITPVIHTCRFTNLLDRNVTKTLNALKDWFREHGLPAKSLDRLEFWTSWGKPHGGIYIDDRGFCFKGTFPSAEEILAFRPHKVTDEPNIAYVCSKCASPNVQMVGWYDPNSYEVVDENGFISDMEVAARKGQTWCSDCGESTELKEL
jgi:hypothetical protein